MKTLIIPDIHDKVAWIEDEIARIEPDQVVFVGDYFDSLQWTAGRGVHEPTLSVTRASATAAWLKQSLEQPNRVHLVGNHDAAYVHPHNPWFECPGFSKEKTAAIYAELGADWGKKLKLSTRVAEYLISHAGVHQQQFGSLDELDGVLIRGEQSFHEGRYDPLLSHSKARGYRVTGAPGITWMDWHYEFRHIPSQKQIVGHTPVREELGYGVSQIATVPETSPRGDINVDCSCNSLLIIEDDKTPTIVDNKSFAKWKKSIPSGSYL